MSTSFKAVIVGTSFSIATFAATTAFAERHSVVILDESYFHTITYLNAGDTVEFTNESEEKYKIVADDASWASGDIVPEGRFILTVPEDIELHFIGYDLHDEEDGHVHEDGNYDDVATGELSFDTAPNR